MAPIIMRAKVVLPPPLIPIKVLIFPFSNDKEIFSKILLPSMVKLIFLSSNKLFLSTDLFINFNFFKQYFEELINDINFLLKFYLLFGVELVFVVALELELEIALDPVFDGFATPDPIVFVEFELVVIVPEF